MKNFFAELKRRNVHKVAIVYAVIAWLLIQVTFIPMFEAPGLAIKTLIVLLVLGFVAVVFISWAYEATPEGMKRTAELSPNEVLPTGVVRNLPSSSSPRRCSPSACLCSIFYKRNQRRRRPLRPWIVNRKTRLLSSAIRCRMSMVRCE